MISSAPRYSFLCSGADLSVNIARISEYLADGIKVIWFGSPYDCDHLNKEFPNHHKIRLLQTYESDDGTVLEIKDGDLSGCLDEFKSVCRGIPSFNMGQYLVEHTCSENISVIASAGTGKTTVMVDRILYLIQAHSVEPSSIAMITFTNEATNQMCDRLQSVMLERFEVTGNDMYLECLEGISRIHISTIDSFSLDLLKKIGVVNGYSGSVSVASYRNELRRVVGELVNDYYRGSGAVRDSLGVNLHDAIDLVITAYDRIGSLGISKTTISKTDWGPVSGDAVNLQGLLRFTLERIDGRLSGYRVSHDIIGLSDTVRDLDYAIREHGDGLRQIHLSHLFIDEFQDTNNEQIRLVSELVSVTGASLFVVGDPKQSIYRFRGADDDAFNTLKRALSSHGIGIEEHELINNYRTDEYVLETLDGLFHNWVRAGLLNSYGSMVSCRGDMRGDVLIRNVAKKSDAESVLVHDISEALSESRDMAGSGKVAVLVRSNKQMEDVARICADHRIPLIARRESPFYLSEPVRDFFAMVSSYVYDADPIAVFNYLCTPYSCMKASVDMDDLIEADGDGTLIKDTMLDYLADTPWSRYEDDFKFKPAMSVIHSMVEEIPLIENYISRLKRDLGDHQELIRIRAEKYRLNLDKLLSILHNHSSGDGIGLYHIFNFLSVSIATNRDEKEVEPDIRGNRAAYCMTIHNSKGLEFDTVIIPFNHGLNDIESNEVIFTPEFDKVGWKFYKERSGVVTELSNEQYDSLKEQDIQRSKREETRILYVAMTRTIRRLVVYRYKPRKAFSWSNLLGAQA